MVPSRRAVLHGAGVALAGSVGGCAGLGGSTRLGEVVATNDDTRPHVVHVLLFEGDDPVYWTSERVPAAEDGVLGTALFEGYPSGLDPSRLLVRLDGQSLSAAERFDFTAHDADRLGLQVEIDDAQRAPALSVWYTAGPDSCEAGEGN